MAGDAPHYTVIGAGIVGMCCALYLQRDGNRVTVIDRLAPGEGTSSGNAGMIQVDACVPIATPGILRDVPKMLLDPLGPLVIRWRYLLSVLPWLIRFVGNARPARVEAISMALTELLIRAKDGYAPLIRDAGAEDLFRDTGELYAYRSEAAWRAALPGHELRRRRGVVLEDLDADALHQLEPSLSPDVRWGVFSPDCRSVADPLELTRRLAGAFHKAGGTILREEVRHIERDGAHPKLLLTETGSHELDRLVIAAGAYSRPFAARFGARVPLESERGYHMMLPSPGVELRVPVLAGDRKFGIVPMEGGVRLAGTAEFAGLTAPPDYRRAEILVALAQQMVPGLDGRDGVAWMGHRPALPDSLPVIDRAPDSERVLLAFGHGHLGLTMAAATGRIVADLAAGRDPGLDLGPYSSLRF